MGQRYFTFADCTSNLYRIESIDSSSPNRYRPDFCPPPAENIVGLYGGRLQTVRGPLTNYTRNLQTVQGDLLTGSQGSRNLRDLGVPGWELGSPMNVAALPEILSGIPVHAMIANP